MGLPAPVDRLKLRLVLEHALPLERRVIAPRVAEEGVAVARADLGRLGEESAVLVVGHVSLAQARHLDAVEAAVGVTKRLQCIAAHHRLHDRRR